MCRSSGQRHQLTEAGVEFASPFEVPQSSSGLSERMMHKIDEDTSTVLPAVKAALARGNVDFIRYEVNGDVISFEEGDIIKISGQEGRMHLAVRNAERATNSGTPRGARSYQRRPPRFASHPMEIRFGPSGKAAEFHLSATAAEHAARTVNHSAGIALASAIVWCFAPNSQVCNLSR
jgi:hypothetical protein